MYSVIARCNTLFYIYVTLRWNNSGLAIPKARYQEMNTQHMSTEARLKKTTAEPKRRRRNKIQNATTKMKSRKEQRMKHTHTHSHCIASDRRNEYTKKAITKTEPEVQEPVYLHFLKRVFIRLDRTKRNCASE